MKDTKSKILLTSRNSDVALKADPRERGILKLKCLSPEESWELLKKMAISWRPGTNNIQYYFIKFSLFGNINLKKIFFSSFKLIGEI